MFINGVSYSVPGTSDFACNVLSGAHFINVLLSKPVCIREVTRLVCNLCGFAGKTTVIGSLAEMFINKMFPWRIINH